MKSLHHYWYSSNPVSYLLLPVSWFYCFIVGIRRKLYQLNIKPSYDSNVPVIVIGNIVVGGSGKTPLLIALCQYLIDHGFKPGVVSRGYGGSATDVMQVVDIDSASVVGDEPLMIFQQANVPVVVGADRVAAVNYLVSNNECDVVLSDDGLQHYRMRRDFEIAVVDSDRRYGNGFCLPAGPLRERLSRLLDINLLVYNGQTGIKPGDCSYSLRANHIRNIKTSITQGMHQFSNKTIHAVAGIGYPARFFNELKKQGLTIIEHPYPDHHQFRQEDFDGWNEGCIIMTEKDAVKCRHLSLPDAWSLSVDAVFSDELESALSAHLLPILRLK